MQCLETPQPKYHCNTQEIQSKFSEILAWSFLDGKLAIRSKCLFKFNPDSRSFIFSEGCHAILNRLGLERIKWSLYHMNWLWHGTLNLQELFCLETEALVCLVYLRLFTLMSYVQWFIRSQTVCLPSQLCVINHTQRAVLLGLDGQAFLGIIFIYHCFFFLMWNPS